MNNNHYKLALRMAEKSVSRFRLGAVLARKNRVISVGYNDMTKSHPLQQRFSLDKSFVLGLHAEIHSCIGVSALDLDGADIYVARILRSGKIALAKPCLVCEKFIADVGIRKVYYSINDTEWGSM